MAEATFRHGEPLMIDYVANTNVTAGQVILIGNTTNLTCGIAHVDITNTEKAAIAVGMGVYDVVALSTYARGAKVYWDDTNNKVTTTSTSNAQFGYMVETAATANSTVEVLHWPYA